MSQTIASLQNKIKVSKDLQTVVRTMKVMAASKIGQYEKSMNSLVNYSAIVGLGLGVSLREISNKKLLLKPSHNIKKPRKQRCSIIIFGSDQGLVGNFNKSIAEFTVNFIKQLGDVKYRIWAIGERVCQHLNDAEIDLEGTFPLPNSMKTVASLVGEILLEMNMSVIEKEGDELFLLYNYRSNGSSYEQKKQRILPLDKTWENSFVNHKWGSKNLPEVINIKGETIGRLIREYLFISIFRACTESLASENTSRLSAMQRADKNIEELLEHLESTYHLLRQSGIDEELFDVISGFEALSEGLKK